MPRRMRATAVSIMALLATALTMGAEASHTCAGTVVQAGDFYVEYRDSDGVWIYQETNLVSGLQRGGKSLAGSVDDCREHPEPYTPDKLIF